MNRFINACYILAIFLFFSCGSKPGENKPDTFTEEDFGKTIELTGSFMQLDSMIKRPVYIHVFGNLLFLQNFRTDYHYQIFNLDTNSQINECVRFGRGPGETITPRIAKITDGDLWIYDSENILLGNYSLHDFISVSNPKPAKQIRLDHTHYRVKVLSDNKILASLSGKLKNTFDLYTSDGKLLESRGEYPDTKLSVSENLLSYRFDCAVSHDDRVFVTYTSGDIIEIHDIKAGTAKRRQGPNSHKPVFKVITQGDVSMAKAVREETYLCYQNTPVIAGNEVFTLYCGDLYETFYKVNGEKTTKILVFDLEGNPLRTYNLSIPIFAFDVNPEKKIIYGITDFPEEYNVVKFEY
jgi:hypothetical protein